MMDKSSEQSELLYSCILKGECDLIKVTLKRYLFKH
jgi:hypothetical protein